MSSGIIDQLNFCRNQRFTGKLCASNLSGNTVNDLEGHCWNIYFYRGRLIGDGAGIHPLRRFRRQFSQQHINLSIKVENNILKSLLNNCLSFEIVTDLLADRHLDLDQGENILTGSLVEVMFDILHYESISQTFNTNQLSYFLEKDPEQELLMPQILLKPEKIWAEASRQFQSWDTNGLLKYSPHLLPKINNLEVLHKQLSAKTLAKTIALLENNHTFRDLAVEIDEDIVILAKSLVETSKKNGLTLQRTVDIDLVDKKLSNAINDATISNFLVHGSRVFTAVSKKLIVHLTQNSTEISAIQSFVEEVGHDYLNLPESTQALLTFLKYSPDLIVIDNTSIGINGQDLCVRLRRTGKFKTTPIVMLGTKNEGLMERLRSHSITGGASGAIDHVSKPLDQKKIFSMINKHIALVG